MVSVIPTRTIGSGTARTAAMGAAEETTHDLAQKEQSMMTVTTEIQVYEVGGEKTTAPYPTLKILAHWNDRDRAVIEMPDGKRWTIIREDMNKAISNAGNCR
jgi:hypothetical protein